jgi:cytochrome c-type biogenesis protein CcmH/NrfG
LDEAATVMQRGLELFPHPHLYSGLGRVSMKRAQQAQARGDRETAVKEVVAARGFLAQAVARDPQDYKSHALLGQVLLNLGERDAARSHLETALRIQPTGPIADVARQYLQRVGN